MSHHETHLKDAISLAIENVRERNTHPFGAVLVKDGKAIARAANEVDALCDPSAHAEMQALRAACRALQTTDMTGTIMYASGYPCAMCLAAMYLAGVSHVFYAYSNEDGAAYAEELSAEKSYLELARPMAKRAMPVSYLPVRLPDEDLYEAWQKMRDAKNSN